MTDKEIIRALECCKDDNCLNCPRWTEEWHSGDCNDFLQDVFDLIKRKDLCILKLQGDLKFVRGTNKRLLELCDEKDAEIERLLETIDKQQAEIDTFADIGKMYSEIKADAYKKFAERLKEKHGLYGEIWESDIDKTVEEMKGE